MRRLIEIACITASAFLVVGCATHGTAKLDAAAALRGPSTAEAEPRASGDGRTSAAWGDWWTAANLFEQAEAGHDSPMNRFNLAVSYENTGRVRQAQAIYRTVVRDGQFTNAATVPSIGNSQPQDRRYNLADEAQRRLAVISPATVTAAQVTGARVGDAEAQRRDAVVHRD